MLSALVSKPRYNELAGLHKHKDEYTPISLYRSSDEKRTPAGNKLHSINGAILLSHWSISYCVADDLGDKQPFPNSRVLLESSPNCGFVQVDKLQIPFPRCSNQLLVLRVVIASLLYPSSCYLGPFD